MRNRLFVFLFLIVAAILRSAGAPQSPAAAASPRSSFRDRYGSGLNGSAPIEMERHRLIGDDEEGERLMESEIGRRLLEEAAEPTYTTYQVTDYKAKAACQGTPAYRGCLPNRNTYPHRGCSSVFKCRQQPAPPASESAAQD